MRSGPCVVVLAAALAGAAGEATAQPCSKPVPVSSQSFQQLPDPTKYAFVWVGEMRPAGPFEVQVIVGHTFAPFQAPRGMLDRASLDRVVGAAYNTTRYPLSVAPDAAGTGRAQTAFTSGGRPFTLKVVAVNAKASSADVQVCW
jgi:hypothetical protein